MQTCLHLLFLSLFFPAAASAQLLTPTSVNSGSGVGAAGGQFINWTLGEPAVQTINATGIIVTQGFLQNGPGVPTSTSFIPALLPNEVLLLPNPTPGNLGYRLNLRERGRVQLRLFDVNGKLLMNAQFQHNGGVQNGSLDLTVLPSGSYLLHIQLFNHTQVPQKQGIYQIQKIK